MLTSLGSCHSVLPIRFEADLRGNLIRELTADSLDLPCAFCLRLQSNRIRTIDRRAFLSLSSLFTLELAHNEIRHLEESTFKAQTALYSLDLSENLITSLHGALFQKGSYIAQLTLFNNNVSVLDALLDTITVNVLDVSGNRLEKLPTAISNRTLLREIHAAYNRIGIVRAATFRSLTNLEVLNLIGNNVTTFEEGAFSDLDKINEIYLQDNPLHSIPRDAFAFSRLHSQSTAIYLNCSATNELPPFSNTIHVHCVTKATNMTLKATYPSAVYFSAMGYACQQQQYMENTLGSALCTQCPIGTYGDASHLNSKSGCSPCPPGGFYQDTTAQNKCLSCGNGKYVPLHRSPGKTAADCIVCPAGTNTTNDAHYRACFCLDNHYRFNRFGECYMCSDNGQKCSDDSLSVGVGYWMSWNISDDYNGTQLENEYAHFVENLKIKSDDYSRDTLAYTKPFPRIHWCPIEDSCNGGADGSQKTRIRQSDMCSQGYKGILCAVCESSHYSWFQKCYKCPSAWRTALQILGVIALVITVIVLLRFAEKVQKSGKHSLADHVAAKIKIVVGFGQVMSGVIQALAHIRWPHVLLSFGQYLKIIELNVIAVAAPSCLSNSLRLNALTTPIFTVSCQAVLLCMIWTYYGIRYIALPKCRKRGSISERNASSAQKSCLRNSWWLLFVCYPANTAQIVAVLPYKPWTCLSICLSSDTNKPFCKWFLKTDLSLECNYDESKSVWIICWSLMVYVVGLPILMFVGLYFKHKLFKQTEHSGDEDDEPLMRSPVTLGDNIIESLHFLTENYETKFWYWEVMEMFRKFVLTCGIQFFGQDSHSGVAIAAILANVFLLLHAQFQPIKRRSEHRLQLLSLFVISLNLMLGTLLVLSSQNTSSTERDMFSVSLLVVNGLFILFILGKIVLHLIWSCKRVKNSRQKCQFNDFLVNFLNGN
ncbi:uncharacterized protein [Oscarella lobularis]